MSQQKGWLERKPGFTMTKLFCIITERPSMHFSKATLLLNLGREGNNLLQVCLGKHTEVWCHFTQSSRLKKTNYSSKLDLEFEKNLAVEPL